MKFTNVNFLTLAQLPRHPRLPHPSLRLQVLLPHQDGAAAHGRSDDGQGRDRPRGGRVPRAQGGAQRGRKEPRQVLPYIRQLAVLRGVYNVREGSVVPYRMSVWPPGFDGGALGVWFGTDDPMRFGGIKQPVLM